MGSINTSFNNVFRDYRSSLDFGVLWRDMLSMCSWADESDLLSLLKREHAIYCPIFLVHYESVSMGGQFRVRSHPCSTSNNLSLPSLLPVRILFATLNLNFTDIENMASTLPSPFHDQFYIGHTDLFRDIPPIPEFVRKVTDSALMGAYNPFDANSLEKEDWAVQLCLRIDNVFSNCPIRANLVVTLFDNAALTEDPQTWPIAPLGPGGRTAESAYNLYCDQLDHLYRGHIDTNRLDVPFVESLEHERAQSFLESL